MDYDYIVSLKPQYTQCPFKKRIEILKTSNKLVPGKNAWKSSLPKDEHDAIIKKIKGILNKISENNFEKLSKQMFDMNLTTEKIVMDSIDEVLEKSIMEPNFGEIYARLCLKMSQKNYSVGDSVFNFRNVLVNKCQREFEKTQTSKHKTIGNIKFIGELFKIDLLPEKIMFGCIKMYIYNIQNNSNQEYNIECLCNLFKKIMFKLDNAKNKSVMGEYYKYFQYKSQDKNIKPRFRFMFLDILDLKKK